MAETEGMNSNDSVSMTELIRWLISGKAILTAALAFFLDVHDLVLIDEEVGRSFAGEADHVAIVVFDPTVDDFTVGELHADGLLLFAQELQVGSFFKSVFCGDDLSLVGTGVRRIHAGGHEG